MPLFQVCVNTGAHPCTFTLSDPPQLGKEISTEMTTRHAQENYVSGRAEAQATCFSSLLVCGESPTSPLPVHCSPCQAAGRDDDTSSRNYLVSRS